MKKRISLLLCLSLFLSMSCMLSGCNQDQKQIIGTWQADINYASAINAGIAAVKDADKMAKYIEFDEFMLKTTFTFFADGTYQVELDSLSVFNAVHGIRDHVAAGMLQYIKDLIQQQGLSMSVNEYLAKIGLDRFSLGESIITDRALSEMADSLSKGSTGLYRVKDGKLYMTTDTNTELTEDNYDTFTIDGDTLTLHECHCQQEAGFENISQTIYPIVLNRVTE